jgi:hypothetical protein
MDSFLLWVALMIVLAVFVACVAHFWARAECVMVLVAMVAVAGPAVGAAMAAIRNQGEFERIRKRSRAMRSELRRLSNQLRTLTRNEDKITSALVRQLAVDAGQTMSDELLDWRIVFEAKTPELQ